MSRRRTAASRLLLGTELRGRLYTPLRSTVATLAPNGAGRPAAGVAWDRVSNCWCHATIGVLRPPRCRNARTQPGTRTTAQTPARTRRTISVKPTSPSFPSLHWSGHPAESSKYYDTVGSMQCLGRISFSSGYKCQISRRSFLTALNRKSPCLCQLIYTCHRQSTPLQNKQSGLPSLRLCVRRSLPGP